TALIDQTAKSPFEPERVVLSLTSAMRSLSVSSRELETMVGSLRSATRLLLGQESGQDAEPSCHFCGRSYGRVRTVMVSSNSNICDECAISTLKTFSHRSDFWFVRWSYGLFEFLVHIGYFFTRSQAQRASGS